MLPRRNGLFLQSPLKILSVLVFHVLLKHSCRGQSQLIGPSQPIVAKVGEDVILPCHLEPAVDVVDMTLEWKRPDLDPMFALVRRAGQDLVHIKNPSYTNRTSVFVDKLKHGNISLKLSKVQPSDEGTYQCYIPKLDKEAFVKLVVDEFQPDSTNTVGLIVGLSICILVILILALFVWRLKRTKSERRNRDGAGGVPEEEPLRTNEKVNKLTAEVKKLTEEKQRDEIERKKLQTDPKTTRTELEDNKREADRKQNETHEKLQDANRQLTRDVQKLSEEKQTTEHKQQNLQTQLDTKTEQQDTSKGEALRDDTDTATGCVFEVEINRCKHICLKYTSKEKQNLRDWKLQVQINNEKTIEYTFKETDKLSHGETVTLWVPGRGSHDPPFNLVWEDLKSWRRGDEPRVTLLSNNKEIISISQFIIER